MVDLIKCFVQEKENFLNTMKNSDKVDLRICVDYKTGEILNKTIGNYENMFLEFTENRASIKGSIHKYYNLINSCGNQNHNDFSYCDYDFAVNSLQEELEINKIETKITNLEFGLNIDIGFDPKELIDKQILMYNYKLPNRNEKFYGKGDFLEFKTTDYSLKIYNKSKQYKLEGQNILRVELKITKSRYLKKHFHIASLEDLDRRRFLLLFNKLLEHFDKLFIVDSLVLYNCDKIEDKVLFEIGTNPFHWLNLGVNSKRKLRFKRKFNAILDEYDLLKTKTDLVRRLKDKFNELMNCNCELLKNVA